MCICGVCVSKGVGGGSCGGGGGGVCGGRGSGGSCDNGDVSVKSLKKGSFLRQGDAKLPKDPFPQF